MEKFRKVLSIGISFSFLVAFSPVSCFSQNFTTRVPDSIGMTDNYDFYIFWLNNKGWKSLAMTFVNDTIHICPYMVHTQNESLFIAVISQELAHYYNYISHGEVLKTDTIKQEGKTNYLFDSNYWKTPPDLNRIVYKGDDGSSVEKAIIIKKASTLKEGIAAEYAYLEEKLGRRGVDWKPLGQYFHPFNNKSYDIIKVMIINSNTIKYFCFDNTNFFGIL